MKEQLPNEMINKLAKHRVVCVAEPSIKEILKIVSPKAKWKNEYRKQRLLKKGIIEPEIKGELGTFEGINIICGK